MESTWLGNPRSTVNEHLNTWENHRTRGDFPASHVWFEGTPTKWVAIVLQWPPPQPWSPSPGKRTHPHTSTPAMDTSWSPWDLAFCDNPNDLATYGTYGTYGTCGWTACWIHLSETVGASEENHLFVLPAPSLIRLRLINLQWSCRIRSNAVLSSLSSTEQCCSAKPDWLMAQSLRSCHMSVVHQLAPVHPQFFCSQSTARSIYISNHKYTMSIYVILRVRRHLSVVLAFLWYDKQSWMFRPVGPVLDLWWSKLQSEPFLAMGQGEKRSRGPQGLCQSLIFSRWT